MKKALISLLAIYSINCYADTETINWYVDGTLYDTTTCESGEYINLPNEPVKDGYTFLGWGDILSTLDVNINGNGWFGRGGFDGGRVVYACNGLDCSDPNMLSDLETYEYKTEFSYGTIYGKSLCSQTSGTLYEFGTPEENNGGIYCWCKITKFVPTGGNAISIQRYLWRYWSVHEYHGKNNTQSNIRMNTAHCNGWCPNRCASVVKSNLVWRKNFYTNLIISITNGTITNNGGLEIYSSNGDSVIESTKAHLIYNYGNGTITESSCVYGELIELPEEPVRQGYKFMGWRVKTSD